jgi:asparagine synthase (glutamine-hydrolysing)
MCGIAGFIGTEPLAETQVQKALTAMFRRGPDHQDHRAYHQGDQYVHLLHARLSIIDLDARSHQPFEKHGLALVFNGEIYNYVEIRQQLAQEGVHFSTSSDTEVLIEAYRKWGEQCVAHIPSKWATHCSPHLR